MSSGSQLIIHTDGAARGNPGPAAFAYTIANSNGEVLEAAGCLGNMTNNQAEYIALVKALENALELGADHRLRIHSDSELLVKQMNGEYRVKDAKLQGYYQQAVDLVRHFPDVTIRHVRRAENSHADRLCNEALDGEPRWANGGKHVIAAPAPLSSADASPGKTATTKPQVARDTKMRAQVLDCLKHAAGMWARGNAADPPPEAVLDDIWNLLAGGKN
jgi:ribonuclease HI